ncbi:hypothetical protein B4135_4222 [Caldibacillus debilis]|uniref:Uncharacterized protein n=1 Tax=Caldibacillus debilis TaxID=301148 RepID=A0A150L718_9BACI|nr:hypothetical protein B4135_4222 [Caldibacillus debilis]
MRQRKKRNRLTYSPAGKAFPPPPLKWIQTCMLNKQKNNRPP